MGKIRFLQLLLVLFLFGSCAREALDVEQELRQESLLGDDRKGPMYDEMDKIKETPLGKKLFKGLIPIKFEYDPSMRPGRMGYVGMGVIRYSGDLESPVGALVFHELFHVYQTKEKAVASRNNEIEAYVAQYLYFMSLEGAENRKFWAVSASFTWYVTKLAEYAGRFSMDLRGDTEFQKLYSKALEELRGHYLYGVLTNYTEEPGPHAFPNLFLLLNT